MSVRSLHRANGRAAAKSDVELASRSTCLLPVIDQALGELEYAKIGECSFSADSCLGGVGE